MLTKQRINNRGRCNTAALAKTRHYNFMTPSENEDDKILNKIKDLIKELSMDGVAKLVDSGEVFIQRAKEKLAENKSITQKYTATEFTREEDYAAWSVCVVRLKDQRKFWIDVWIDTEYGDILTDWNKNIFITTSSEDLERKNIQENLDEFNAATNAAIEWLLEHNEITGTERGEYWPIDTIEEWEK